MPELPEVETIARTLRPDLTGRFVSSVQVYHDGVVQGDRQVFDQYVAGRCICDVGRRGKLLLLHLAPLEERDGWPLAVDIPDMLAFHLRMSGRLFLYAGAHPPGKHTRLVFTLDTGQQLFFDDARKFGLCRALSSQERAQWRFWATLGPEPLEISRQAFVRLFMGRRKGIKALLLDQTLIAGVGNIYADESLFCAGIRPDVRPAEWSVHVAGARLGRLHHVMCDVLRTAISQCGSSIRDYRNANGDAGAFQNTFCVYGRSGLPCVSCQRPLVTAKIAGRTTVYCGHCQH